MTVLDWLLDSDPALRWQVLRDLIDASPNDVAAERGRVAVEGWGARLLARLAVQRSPSRRATEERSTCCNGGCSGG